MPLGLSAYHSVGEFSPRFEYNAKSGRISKVDRTADGSGTIKIDVTMQQPMFAFDIGSIMIGWANFGTGGAPSVVMVPYGQPMPPRPDRAHKAGFRARVWDGQEAAPRELSATAGATVNAIEALWDSWTAAPEAAAGQIPVIQLVNVTPITSGRGTNYAPVFRLVQWIERVEKVFGPRTVAPPGAPPIVVPPAPIVPSAAWPAPAPAAAAWPVAA